jgi:hypothetical protein
VTRFIVHIGPHKTGTTYLQIMLDALRDSLSERGICIPSVWNSAPGFPSHMQLVLALRCGDLTQVREQLQEILALRPRCVVISSEALSRLTLEQIVQLRQLLGSAPVEVVYYVRRWPERLPSLWQETVKFGHRATFPEFLATQLVRHSGSELWDTSMIDRFSAVFGASQVRLVSYSHLVDSGIDIGNHFLNALLGLSDIWAPSDTHPNQSLHISETELIRALNVIHVRRGGDESAALRSWFLHCRSSLALDTVLKGVRACMDTIRLDEAEPGLSIALQDLMTRYARSIVPPRHVSGLHALRAIDVPFVRPDYLLEPSVSKVLNEIYEMYDHTLQTEAQPR